MLKRTLVPISVCLMLATSAWSRVLVRWNESAMPSKPLSLAELVVPFEHENLTLIQNAARQGYRVYVQVPLPQFADAEKVLSKDAVAGFIVEPGNAHDAPEKLQAAYPKVRIQLLAIGKQPQMRGQTVTNRNGVLQVSSPTAQPWLDSNLAMIRFQQAVHPDGRPIYTFEWELTDSLQQENGPTVNDYALAIAESGTLHADLVLNLHPSLETALLANQPSAWATWNQLVSYIKFASALDSARTSAWSNIGVIAGDYDAAYEPMNLMARHNIPFRIFSGVNSCALESLNVAVALTSPDQPDLEALSTFAERGGTVIVVDAKGKYPWQSVQPVQTAEHAVSYAAGKGRVFELSEPISDPETFAEDVRRLTPKNDFLISLWNALTTIAVPYRDDRTGDIVLEMVNFAEEPMRVQVQLKGSYSSIGYETPDHGCCENLTAVKHDGFTDFIVPSLVIGGRVHLKGADSSPDSNKK